MESLGLKGLTRLKKKRGSSICSVTVKAKQNGSRLILKESVAPKKLGALGGPPGGGRVVADDKRIARSGLPGRPSHGLITPVKIVNSFLVGFVGSARKNCEK